MTAPFSIRPYQKSDRPALESMAREVVSQADVFVHEDPEDVLAYWLAPGAKCMVAVAGGEVVGTSVLKPNQVGRGDHVANAGFLVARKARGQGVGRELAVHCIELARELGFAAMQFNMVVASNTSAVRLWQDLGFEIVGRVPAAFRHPREGLVDFLILHRFL